VCDGVGGSERGEVASKVVSESVGEALKKMPAESVNIAYINQLLNDAQVKLIKYANSLGGALDMATTFSLILLTDDKVFVAWCGDTRIYHLRKGRPVFKSEDHSLVNSLVKAGEITEDEARVHPQKNMILKAIRADDGEAEAEGLWITDIQDGDYFMACTDGLLENIGERDLKFLLEQYDKGSIDLIPAFQQFCLDKTRDNYSMYLLRVKVKKKTAPFVRRLPYLVLLLVILAAAGYVLLEKTTLFDASPATVMPAKDSAGASRDTVVFTEKPTAGAAADSAGTDTVRTRTPKVKTPGIDTAKVKTPRVKTPKIDTPKTDTAKTDTAAASSLK